MPHILTPGETYPEALDDLRREEAEALNVSPTWRNSRRGTPPPIGAPAAFSAPHSPEIADGR
jgi:hypothetical protein